MLPLSRIEAKDADAQMFRKIGLITPLTRPEIGEVMAGGAAERVGPAQRATSCASVGGTAIVDGQQLREVIRASVDGGQPRAQAWQIERGGQTLELEVTPEVRDEGAASRSAASAPTSARRRKW